MGDAVHKESRRADAPPPAAPPLEKNARLRAENARLRTRLPSTASEPPAMRLATTQLQALARGVLVPSAGAVRAELSDCANGRFAVELLAEPHASPRTPPAVQAAPAAARPLGGARRGRPRSCRGRRGPRPPFLTAHPPRSAIRHSSPRVGRRRSPRPRVPQVVGGGMIVGVPVVAMLRNPAGTRAATVSAASTVAAPPPRPSSARVPQAPLYATYLFYATGPRRACGRTGASMPHTVLAAAGLEWG